MRATSLLSVGPVTPGAIGGMTARCLVEAIAGTAAAATITLKMYRFLIGAPHLPTTSRRGASGRLFRCQHMRVVHHFAADDREETARVGKGRRAGGEDVV